MASLTRHNVPPEMLILEVTETTAGKPVSASEIVACEQKAG
ncbi:MULTISPECIES: hypothetical protein [Enterobacterales]